MRTGDDQKALLDFTKTLELKPDEPAEILSQRAELYQRMGDNEKAIADLTGSGIPGRTEGDKTPKPALSIQ